MARRQSGEPGQARRAYDEALRWLNRFPGARLLLFSDAGWAGPRAAGWSGRPLLSAGIGASFLDGLVRLDLARALRAPRGWRLDCYVDGIL